MKKQQTPLHKAGYENLANAIIMRAVEDYRKAKTSYRRSEIAQFFKSGWFRALSNVDGNLLLKKLEEESKKVRDEE